MVPGSVAVHEYAGECEDRDGMAWVRIANVYPATGVGVQSTRPGVCGHGTGYDLEVGAMRSIEVEEEAVAGALEELERRFVDDGRGVTLRRVAGGYGLAAVPDAEGAARRLLA